MPGPEPQGDGTLTTTLAVCNAILTMNALIEYSTITTLVDNAAMRRLCGSTTEPPAYKDLNGMIARCLAAITGPIASSPALHAEGGLRRVAPRDMVTNLTPYPQMHFNVPSLAPLKPDGPKMGDDLSEVAWQALTQGVMTSCDLSQGKNMAVGVYGKGMLQFMPAERVLEWKMRRNGVCVDWSPVCFNICSYQNAGSAAGGGKFHGEAVCFHNSTAIKEIVSKLNQDFDDCKEKGLGDYAHYVGDTKGLGDLSLAEDNMASLLRDFECDEYNECGGGESEEEEEE